MILRAQPRRQSGVTVAPITLAERVPAPTRPQVGPSTFGPLDLWRVMLHQLLMPLLRAFGGPNERGARHGGHVHDCPGRCGREVGNWRFGCLPCLSRLPVPLRAALAATAAGGEGRDAALDAAAAFYRAEQRCG